MVKWKKNGPHIWRLSVKPGDLVRYKSGTIWDVEDLFIVLKVSN